MTVDREQIRRDAEPTHFFVERGDGLVFLRTVRFDGTGKRAEYSRSIAAL